MRNHAIILVKSLHEFQMIVLVEVVNEDLTHVVVAVRQPQQPLSIKVTRDSVLIELQFTLSVWLEDVLLKITQVNWREWFVRKTTFHLLGYLNCQYAVKMHKVMSERSLAIVSMCCIVRIIYNLPEVYRAKCFSIKPLA